MNYTFEEINKAKELFRKQTGNYPKTATDLKEALDLLYTPEKPVIIKEVA